MTITTTTFNSVNVGSSANDGTGDDLRSAFIKINTNFSNIATIGFNTGNISVANEIDSVNATISGVTTVNGNLIVGNVYVPTSNSSVGTKGQIVWDSGHIYICVATNTWRRANIAAW